MSLPILYTTTDRIRAALGVSAKEILDQQIVDTAIDDQLMFELITVYPGAAVIKAKIDASTATPDEQQTYKIIQLYCMYQGAYIMLTSAQTLLFQQIGDGQTSQTRFQSDDLQNNITRVQARATLYAGALNPVYGCAAGLGFSLIGVVSPAYNPVTDRTNGIQLGPMLWSCMNSDMALLIRCGCY